MLPYVSQSARLSNLLVVNGRLTPSMDEVAEKRMLSSSYRSNGFNGTKSAHKIDSTAYLPLVSSNYKQDGELKS